MKFSAVLAAVAGAAIVSAQGYNSTTKAASSTQHASVYDSRTVNVPSPSAAPTTALTSIYTITSSCGSVQILLPSTKVFPLNGNGTTTATRSATYTGTSTGGAVRTGVAMLAGAGGLLAALAL